MARKSADVLHQVRCRAYVRPVPRTATAEEKSVAEQELRKKVVHDRCKKMLQRSLQGVAVKRAAVRIEGSTYTGPSEESWKRKFYGYERAGVHNETIKPSMTKRKLAQRKAADAKNEKMGKDLSREAWRTMRRNAKNLGDAICKPVKPPKRATCSTARKAKRRKNAKESKRLRNIRDAASSFLENHQPQALCLEDARIGTHQHAERIETRVPSSLMPDASTIEKRSRRGGRSAKRVRLASQYAERTFMAPQPKWSAKGPRRADDSPHR